MASYRGIPYRAPQQTQADTGLGFDPNQVTPWSPQELDQRQPVMDASTSLQDAVNQQSQAQAPQSGLGGVISSPAFQLAVPAALTALSAIFPRHMANAGAIGMAGYRTIEDTNMMQNRTRQAQASDVVKQRQDDLNRQRLRYALEHTPNIDPTLASSIELQSHTDVAAAAKALDAAAQNDMKNTTYQTGVSNFDAKKQLQPGQSTTFQSPYGASTTFKQPEPSPYLDYASGDPALQKRATDWQAASKTPPAGNEYADYKAGRLKAEPGLPLEKIAADYKLIGAEHAASSKDEIAAQTVKGMMDGKIPVPLPSARGGVSEDMQRLYAEASKQGYDIKKAQYDQLAQVQSLKTMNGQQWQGELKNVKVVEGMLNNTEAAYNAWLPYSTGMKTINSVALKAASQFDTPAGAAARQLLASLTETRTTMAQVLRGGAAPTEDSAQAAQQILSEDLPLHQFEAALKVSRAQMGMRKWALLNPEPLTPGSQPAPDTMNADPMAGSGNAQTPVAGKYKTKAELDAAYEKHELSLQAARKYAKMRGWRP